MSLFQYIALKISTIIIIILLGGVGYLLFFNGTPSSTNVTSLEISNITTGLDTFSQSGESYSGSTRIFNLNGEVSVDGELNDTVYLLVNGVKQNVEVEEGMIDTQAILDSGTNTIQLIVENEDGEVVFSSDEWTLIADNVESTDLIMVLSWNTDYDDVDMSIIGPNDEEAYFSCQSYACNGIGEQDLDDTDGYGPETFVLNPNASSGVYQIRANYYADHGNISSPLVTMVVKTQSGTNTYTHTFNSSEANGRDGPYWNPVNVTIS